MSNKIISVFTAAAVSLVVNVYAPIALTAVSVAALTTTAQAKKKGTRKPKPVIKKKKCGSPGAPKCRMTKKQKTAHARKLRWKQILKRRRDSRRYMNTCRPIYDFNVGDETMPGTPIFIGCDDNRRYR